MIIIIMARFIAKTLLLQATASQFLKKATTTTTTTTTSSSSSSSSCVKLVCHRHQSSQATKPKLQLTDIEREEYEVALKLLDDHIQRILVKKATPDWLPFLPGSSFWVPPRPSPSNVASFIHKFTNQLTPTHHPLSLSLATHRGWPSSQHFFIQENESAYGGDTGVEINTPEGMEVTVQVKVLTFPENITLSEDEEG